MSRRSQARAEARMAAQSARRHRRRPDRMLVSAIMLFFFTAFLLVSFNGELEWEGFALAVIVPVLVRLSTMWVPRLFPADKLLLAIAAVGAEYAFLLFVLRLEAVVTELSSTAPALLWATAALGLALFLLYDLCLDRLTALYRRRRK